MTNYDTFAGSDRNGAFSGAYGYFDNFVGSGLAYSLKLGGFNV